MLELNDQSPQNEPQQIDRPSQYPTTTRIDNGVAYDITGKALGNVNDDQVASSAQPTPAPAQVGTDDFSQFKSAIPVTGPQQTKPPSQSTQVSKDDFSQFKSAVPVATPPTQKQAAKPQSQPGLLERAVTSVANATGVPSLINAIGADKIQHAAETTGDVLLKAFGAPGTFGGETLKDIASQPTALKQIWRAGEIALNPIMSRGGAYPAANISQFMGKTPSIIEDIANQPTILKKVLRAAEFAANPLLDPSSVKATTQFAEGMTSPKNLAIMVATGGLGSIGGMAGEVLPRLVSAGFSAQLIYGVGQKTPAVYQAIKNGDFETAQNLLIKGGLELGMASLAAEHAIKGGPVTPQRRAEKAWAAVDDANDSNRVSQAILNQRAQEHALGAEQASQATKDAITARASGAPPEAIKAAQENASAAAADAIKKQQALREAQEAHNQNLVAHAQAVREATAAASDLDAHNRYQQDLADKRAQEAADQIKEGPREGGFLEKLSAWHEQRGLDKEAAKKLDPIGVNTKDSEFGEAFNRAFPATKLRPHNIEDRQTTEAYVKDYHDNVAPVENTADLINALQYQVDAIGDATGDAIGEHGDKPITTNPIEDARKVLAEKDQVKAGFLKKGMKALEPYTALFGDEIPLTDAEKVRKQLVEETKSIKQKTLAPDRTANSDFNLRQTDPAYAAISAVLDSLREGIDQKLEDEGVDGMKEMREDASRLIRGKTAMEAQRYNNEKIVRGTSTAGPVRKLAAKGAVIGGAGVGAAAGAATGIPFGLEVGAGLGAEVGRRVGKIIAPSDVTRDQAVKEMVGKAEAGAGPRKLEAVPPKPKPPTPPPPAWPVSGAPFVPESNPAPYNTRNLGIENVGGVLNSPPTTDLTDIPLANRGGVIRRRPFSEEKVGQRLLNPGPEPTGPNIDVPHNVRPVDTAPREYSQLHADLATHYGEPLGKTPYQDLEDRFNSDVDIKQEHGVPLESSEKALLKAMNTQKATEVIEAKKEAEKAAKEAASQKEKDDQSTLETNAKKAQEEMPFKVGPEMDLPEGFLDARQLRAHELGHIIGGQALGFPGLDVISHEHPLMTDPNSQAQARLDKSSLTDANGRYSDAKIAARLGDVLTLMYSGPVAQELIHGVEIDTNPSAAGDLSNVDGLLKRYGVSGEDAERIKQKAIAQAREILAPHAEAIERYSRHREAGLPEEYHVSKGTVQKLINDTIGSPEDEDETINDNKPAARGLDEEGGKPVTGSKSENEGGAAPVREDGKLEAKANEGRSGAGRRVIPAEISTGDETVDNAIREGGGIPGGKANYGPGLELTHFRDPQTGSTLAFREGEPITTETVKAKLQESRRAFNKGNEPHGSQVVSPSEAKKSGKEFGSGWNRVENFRHPDGEDVDIWHSEPLPEFPRAGETADGLTVGDHVANTDSIAASLTDYKERPGVREVPMGLFENQTINKSAKVKALAAQIKASGHIDPVIVVVDKDGPYILEGGHRFDALKLLGKKSIPALVVDDMESQNGASKQ